MFEVDGVDDGVKEVFEVDDGVKKVFVFDDFDEVGVARRG